MSTSPSRRDLFAELCALCLAVLGLRRTAASAASVAPATPGAPVTPTPSFRAYTVDYDGSLCSVVTYSYDLGTPIARYADVFLYSYDYRVRGDGLADPASCSVVTVSYDIHDPRGSNQRPEQA